MASMEALVSEAFLQDHRLVLEREEEGPVWCYSDTRQPPEVLNLLMLLTEGKLRMKYVDSNAFEGLSGSEDQEEQSGAGTDRVIVKWIREMIDEAVADKASDIHLEPCTDKVQVRFRLDGRLRIWRTFGLEYKEELVSRVKVMADLDIAEKRRPQDGKIRLKIKRRPIDFRVSVIPTGLGEKVVIRILDVESVKLNLERLGMPPEVGAPFREVIHRPFGMLLVTGPTGSGKTTTLYAALNEIKSETLNIMTIEDPIEYQLEGLTQTQVRNKTGFGFCDALRSFLRQDPNVIMVGEIRDLETAEMSVRAALTGHLVLSTLHTNTAPGAVPRLADMGVETYLIATALHLSVAQRLLRRLCPHCQVPCDGASDISQKYRNELMPGEEVFTGSGCGECGEMGYQGRVSVFEAFLVNDKIRQAIHDDRNASELAALAPDYHPMIKHGLELVRQRKTSFDELLREVILG